MLTNSVVRCPEGHCGNNSALLCIVSAVTIQTAWGWNTRAWWLQSWGDQRLEAKCTHSLEVSGWLTFFLHDNLGLQAEATWQLFCHAMLEGIQEATGILGERPWGAPSMGGGVKDSAPTPKFLLCSFFFFKCSPGWPRTRDPPASSSSPR
jgi:hypothetical protein